MKLIQPKAELLIQESGVEGIYKQIELCGRTCYKSEDKIAEGTAKPFVDRMINSKHTAMLEQGTVYLIIKWWHVIKFIKYLFNPYSKIRRYKYITTNLRVLVENGWLDDLKFVYEPTEYHKKRYTFKLITDRGVSHELVRHRVMSFAQESTRYCNYSKGKFGGELTFIIPAWVNNKDEISYVHDPHNLDERDMLKEDFGTSYGGFLHQLCLIEDEYLWQLQQGRTPQEARQVLPNAIKTEICMNGFASDWRFFFDLRLFGKTGAPHPNMLQLAKLMQAEAEKQGIWEDIMKQPSKFE